MKLETKYLGLTLPHPFILGASPLASNLDRIRHAEDAGVAAITLHSLFEEQVLRYEAGMEAHVYAHEDSFSEAGSYFTKDVDYHYGPEEYLTHISRAKEAVDVPIIASLNGTHLGGWSYFAKEIARAGADALELNLYYLPRVSDESAEIVESRLEEIVKSVSESVDLPIAVKLSPFFTSLAHVARRLENAGAKALVLFNRFYQPDINIEELEPTPTLKLSDSSELLLRLRWLAVLFGRYQMDLACTGGVHNRDDALKAIMSGADVLQLVSELLLNGVDRIGVIRREVENWMEEMEYESLAQMRGSMSYCRAPNPEAIERGNYLRILQSWEPGNTLTETQ
ncbi:dihydroorotate dehydrogenase-like protein [Cerasicoccus arenae]|uniref:Dihydroorotate dehydrogenase n=1 Tax=Cerasicoccus arenae TaxID=424488 RepID=A0A8J3DH81_9BACT|nr:dihydroorotate dehydrogenase-like protein [Cerasicoccus arenae]MBK1857190.1 dihydroorotate dehydrogenase-like protein [Cerasicoccus arenae]GHB99887.1 dihydroorotate dehydrogenase [Cerasicoccus arenae]